MRYWWDLTALKLSSTGDPYMVVLLLGNYLLLLCKLEVSGENIIHKIVKVGSINQPLSLVAWVHGSPAELVISYLTLHEAPHRATHHRHWLLAWQDQDLTSLINLHSLPEKLTCIVIDRNTHLMIEYHI